MGTGARVIFRDRDRVTGRQHISDRIFEKPESGWRPILRVAIAFALGFGAVLVFLKLIA